MLPTRDYHPKLLPAYQNLAWNIPAIFTDEIPLLAVMELKTRKGIDILEKGTLYNALFRKAMEYCSSLPGIKIHYGRHRDGPVHKEETLDEFTPAVRDGSKSIIILLELPSVSIWQDFNKTAFLDLLCPMFEGNPVCWYLDWKWTPPENFQISSDVELLIVDVGTADGIRNPIRRQCREAWDKLSTSVRAAGKYDVHGDWIQHYCMAHPFSDNPPGRRAEVHEAWDEQRELFLGMLCHVSNGSEASDDDIETLVSEFVQDDQGHVVTRRSLKLKLWQEDQIQDAYTSSTPLPQLASPLFLTEAFEPIFRRENGMGISATLLGEDMTWRSKYHAPRPKVPGPTEPRGGYHPTGSINQYSCPLYPDPGPMYPENQPTLDPEPRIVDLLWLTFMPGTLVNPYNETEGPGSRFTRFRKDLHGLERCEALYWARKHEEQHVVVLFIGKSI